MTEKSYRVPAVQRAFAVLELIARAPSGARMIDAAEALALPKSSTFAILNILEELGYVTRDHHGRYRLGSKLAALAASAERHFDLTEVARPALQRLHERLGLTVHLATVDDLDAVYLDKIESEGLVRFDTYVGKRSPAHLTAVGKAYISALDTERGSEILTRVAERYDKSAAADLCRQITDTQQRGWALEDEEEVAGVRCVAAAVLLNSDTPLAAVGCIGLTSQITDSRLADIGSELVKIAHEISTLLASHAGTAGRTHLRPTPTS